MSSKGQLTAPRALRHQLGLKPGGRVEVYPLGRDGFVARIRRASRIMDFARDLAELDQELRTTAAADRSDQPSNERPDQSS